MLPGLARRLCTAQGCFLLQTLDMQDDRCEVIYAARECPIQRGVLDQTSK